MKKYFSVFLLCLLFSAGFVKAQDSAWVNVWMTRCDNNPVEASVYYPASTGDLAGPWRYADGTKFVEYKLNLDWFKDYATAGKQLYFRTYVWNEYWIRVSEDEMLSIKDGRDFATYAPASDTATVTMRDGSNGGWHEASLMPYYEDNFTDFYVAFFDGRTGDGWGPSIAYIAVAYKEAVDKLPQQKVNVVFDKGTDFTVDGDFSDWSNKTQWVDLKKGETNIVETGTVGANFEGKAALAFADTMLFVGAEVTDADFSAANDKLVFYFGAYYTWEGLTAGHVPANAGALAGYRSKKEPDYKIEIPLDESKVMMESMLLQDTVYGAFKVVQTATGYKVEAQIPYSSLYKNTLVSDEFSVYPTPTPGVYGMDDLELPQCPFAFQVVDGDASGFKGSLTTAFEADVDENPSSWALVTNTTNDFPFEYFAEGPVPPTDKCLLFTSENKTAVTIPNPGVMLDTNNRQLTMEAWIKATSWRSGTYQGNVINREDNKTYTLRTGGTGQINANVQAGGDLETASALDGPTMKEGVWYHVAVTVTDTLQLMYVNGQLIYTNDDYISLGDPAEAKYADSTSILDLVIGNSAAYPSRGFDGYIADVRMYNYARSAEQIAADMASAPTATELQSAGLVGYWPLNEGSGQVAHDLSKYGNDGYLGLGDSVETTDPEWNGIATEDEPNAPTTFNLAQNYPNPFNPTTTIKYTIPSAGMVKLTVYNILGQEVKTLVNEVLSAGTHQVMWKGDNNFGSKLSSGVYLYRIDFNNTKQMVKKMIMLK